MARAYWLSLAVEDVSPQGNRDKASSQMCSIKSVFSPFWSILSASSQDVDEETLRGWWADQERGWASVVVGDWRCSVMMELVGSAASLCNKHGKAFKWLSMRARRDHACTFRRRCPPPTEVTKDPPDSFEDALLLHFHHLRRIHNAGNPSACVRWHAEGRQPHHGCMTTF